MVYTVVLEATAERIESSSLSLGTIINISKREVMSLSLSRGPQIDTEQCAENAGGNRFDLVLIASARAREISRRHKHDELTTQVNAPVSALLDIQNGLVGREYLKKV